MKNKLGAFSLIEALISMFLIIFNIIPLNILCIKALNNNKKINSKIEKQIIYINLLEECKSFQLEKIREKECLNKKFKDLNSLSSYLEIKVKGDVNEEINLSIKMQIEMKYYVIYEISINNIRGYGIIEKK